MKDPAPLVTVYITNHNYGEYLEQAIESVLQQSYKNIELIIIDDGSKDNSRQLLKIYQDRNNIKIIYQKNKGLPISNNIALKQANGFYIIRVDADDYLDKNAIKILVNEFDNDEIGMVFGDWYVVNGKGEVLSIEKRHDFQNDVKIYDQPAHGAFTMFRTDYIKTIGGYNEKLLMQDGYELWFRFIDKYKIKNINLPIFYYRKHGRSLSDKNEKILATRSTILKDISKRSKKKDPSITAIFPVRGEKLDFRSKPFFKLNGKFLIDISIETFSNVSGIDLIIISSPDNDVHQYVSEKYDSSNVISLKRPLNISYIGVDLIKTLFFLNEKENIMSNYDAFMVHSIEVPFIKKHLIESAINVYKIFNTNTVISVTEDNRQFFKHSGNGMKPINYTEGIIRYEKDKCFVGVPGFLLRDCNDFTNTKNMLGSKIGHVTFDKISSFLIEDNLDMKVAEFYKDKDFS